MDDSQIRRAADQIADLFWKLHHQRNLAFEAGRPKEWRELREQIVGILLTVRDQHYIYE